VRTALVKEKDIRDLENRRKLEVDELRLKIRSVSRLMVACGFISSLAMPPTTHISANGPLGYNSAPGPGIPNLRLIASFLIFLDGSQSIDKR